MSALEALTWTASPDGSLSFDDPEPRFRVGQIEFRCAFAGSNAQLFSICKDRVLIEEYLDIVEEFRDDNFVEIGIGPGGSVALTALVAPPRKLVAVELETRRVVPLDNLIAERNLGERVRLHYGVDQADRAELARIMALEFGDEPLGLVVDDASHRLDETRASFEALFPRLRPNGLFVIEDWAFHHYMTRGITGEYDDPWGTIKAEFGPPLSRLVIELILAQAESDEFVREVRLDARCTRIRRGDGELDPASFRVEDLITDDLGLLADG